MKLLDRLAIHSLIKTITNFILQLVALLSDHKNVDPVINPDESVKPKGVLSRIKKIIEKMKKRV